MTLDEVNQWIKRNTLRTWSFPNFGKENSTLEIKYFRFNLDTRDMKIFRIEIDGFADKVADFREDFDGTILELLESKLEVIE